jgi:hypothetical protein
VQLVQATVVDQCGIAAGEIQGVVAHWCGSAEVRGKLSRHAAESKPGLARANKKGPSLATTALL